jgi:hypothetical protein
VTRSHKYNDKDHAGLADGTAAPQEHLPRYFAKHGHVDVDPKKTKKDGGGKGNWYVCHFKGPVGASSSADNYLCVAGIELALTGSQGWSR